MLCNLISSKRSALATLKASVILYQFNCAVCRKLLASVQLEIYLKFAQTGCHGLRA